MNLFQSVVKNNDIKGIIFRAFGSGDPSSNLLDDFKYLKDKNIPIIITSQIPNGVSSLNINEPGEKISINKLAIPAWDMSIETQTIKLSWFLGQKIKYNDIEEKMIFDYRGEINTFKK